MKSLKLIVLHVLQVLTIVLFCVGYFPRKPILNDIASFLPNDTTRSKPAVFDKLIVVMIDALRSDFLYDKNSNFKNLHSIYNQGHAMGFTAYANPPTVTLPRLKGILTGSTPIFLDAILNVAEGDDSSNLKDHDSILKQFYLSDKKINFYGDDTWLKLFGTDMFNDYEGTTSFFVKDYTEVDNNVTRHIEPNFTHKNNWDILILHYLGLDHIGHAMGSSPPEMGLKQAELDGIINDLYNKSDENTLMLVLGDHGMTDSGNHGGSTDSETHAGMCFISKKFNLHQEQTLPIEKKENDFKYLKMIQQVDLVPTLMSLFNLPVPKNNVGVVIEDILDVFMSETDKKLFLNRNQKQLYELLNNSPNEDKNIYGNEIQVMKQLQGELMDSSTNYNYPLIYTSLCLSFILIPMVFFYTIELDVQYLSVVALSLILGISSFATSFIEEEHKVWYWLLVFALVSTTFLFNKFEIKTTAITIGLLCCSRIMKSWNNSGQKYFFYDLISNHLKKNEKLCWWLILATLILTVVTFDKKNYIGVLSASYLSWLIFVYKLNWEKKNSSLDLSWMKYYDLFEENDDLIHTAKKIFSILATLLVLGKLLKNKSEKSCSQIKYVTYFLIIQSSIINIPMFSIFIITEYLLDASKYSEKTKIVIEMMLEHLTFFFFGNTNSIATIDLINAYNGVSKNYKIEIVGFLMLCSTFAPSIYFSLHQSKRDYNLTLKYSLVLNSIWSAFFLLSCFIGRYHLFVWSVFSPKLCYYLAWNVFMHLIVKVALPLIIF